MGPCTTQCLYTLETYSTISIYIDLNHLCIIHYPFLCVDTTDLQTVKVTQMNDGTSSLLVVCRFMIGSSARGCVVVLKSTTVKNVTRTIKRQNMSAPVAQEIVETDHPLSCFEEVLAYDLECSGLVGTLPVPGELVLRSTIRECLTNLEGNIESRVDNGYCIQGRSQEFA